MSSECMVTRFKFATALRNKVKDTIGSPEMNLLKYEDVIRLPKDSLPHRVHRLHQIAAKYLSRVNRKIDTEQNKIKKLLLKEKLNMELSQEYVKVANIFHESLEKDYYEKYPMLREINRNRLWEANAEQRRSKNLVDYILMVDKTNVTQ